MKNAVFLIACLSASCKIMGSSPASDVRDSGAYALAPTAAVVNTQPEKYDCNTLDYGLYWFGKGNQAIKSDGQPNQFYDPTKPTVIFVHGWALNNYKNPDRSNFMFARADTKTTVDTAAAWVDAGWNIGIFYWTQFADEPNLQAAEAKIWSTQGPGGMRWRQCDGTFRTDGSPTVPLGQVFFQAFSDAMQNYTGPNIRIVGHSLGNQMASRLAALVTTGVATGSVPAILQPKRVSLVDPYWTMGLNVDADPGAQVRTIITNIGSQIIFEWYKYSGLLNIATDFDAGDFNTPLIQIIGQTRPILGFVSNVNPIVQEADRHIMAPLVYFWSFAFPPPVGCAQACDQKVPSASMPDDDVRASLSQGAIWLQTSGANTSDPSDDVYTKQNP